MTPAEADRIIIQARRTLASHRRSADGAAGEARDDYIAAISSIIGTLREIAAEHPGKREKVEALIGRYVQ